MGVIVPIFDKTKRSILKELRKSIKSVSDVHIKSKVLNQARKFREVERKEDSDWVDERMQGFEGRGYQKET